MKLKLVFTGWDLITKDFWQPLLFAPIRFTAEFYVFSILKQTHRWRYFADIRPVNRTYPGFENPAHRKYLSGTYIISALEKHHAVLGY